MEIMKWHVFTMLLCITLVSQAQLLMTTPLEVSGGLSGNEGHSRISFNTHYIDINSRTFNSYASYDWLSNKLRGGVGIVYSQSRLRNQYAELNTENAGVFYSPKFILKQKVALSPFAGLRYSYAYNYSLLNVKQENSHVLFPQVGILANKKTWFLGYKTTYMDNIQKFINNYQVGKFFKLKDENYGIGVIWLDNFDFNLESLNYFFRPNLVYTYLKLSRFSLGVGKRRYGFQNWSYTITYRTNNWKIGYSILSPEISPRHEIGFQYIFKKKEENKLFSIPLKN